MSTSITFNGAHRIPLASEFFMARRPILDRQQQLAAHELLFCHVADTAPPEDLTSSSVINDVKQHGLVRIIGDGVAFLHVDADALRSDVFHGIPQDRVVLTLMEASAAPDLQERINSLMQHGFRFALNVSSDSHQVQALLPLVDTVRLDIRGRSMPELVSLCRLFRTHRKTLLAENVDTREQYEKCAEAGFDLLQGYHFAQPRIQTGTRLSASQLAITEIMALVASDADSAEIEHRVKGNVALSLNLLRLVNTPAVSSHRIDSLRQALMVLGRNQLQRWLQVMLYADAGSSTRSMMPLLTQATTRGRLLELVAQKLMPINRSIADTAFTVGIMSLMPTLFSMPMPDILQQIQVSDDVNDALLYRAGYFGDLLKLAEYSEWINHDGTQLVKLLRRMRLSYDDLYALQLAAFEWSDQVSRGLH